MALPTTAFAASAPPTGEAARPVASPALVPPPGARPYERGPHDVAVLDGISAITEALRPTYGRLAFERWLVPGDATWDRVVAHYQAQLRPGWTTDRLPDRLGGYRLRSWTGDAGQRVAVALTGEVFEAPTPFRVVVVARPAD